MFISSVASWRLEQHILQAWLLNMHSGKSRSNKWEGHGSMSSFPFGLSQMLPSRDVWHNQIVSLWNCCTAQSHLVWANQRSMQWRVLLCLQGCDSSMWVRAARGATSPQGPLQDGYNSSPRVDGIAGIPTRNRDAFAQGTDTLAAALQSIHQSLKGVATAKGHSSHPHSSP